MTGRMLVAFLFLGSGLGKIGGYGATVTEMTARGVPWAEPLLIVSIAVQLVAGGLVAIGIWVKPAAALLALWIIPVTVVFHDFWRLAADAREVEFMMFMKNVAILGALLLLTACGTRPGTGPQNTAVAR